MIWSRFSRCLNSLRIPSFRATSAMRTFVSDDSIDEPEEEYLVFRQLSESATFAEEMRVIEQRETQRLLRTQEQQQQQLSPSHEARDPEGRPGKTPAETHISLRLPFSTDTRMRTSYARILGSGIRIGRLLEDLDSLAAEIGYRFCDGLSDERPLTIVTACLNRLELESTIHAHHDVVLSGRVVWVGTSSFKVHIRVFQGVDPEYYVGEIDVMECLFTMVAKDRTTGKPIRVNSLILESEEDRILFDRAEEIGRVDLERDMDDEELRDLHRMWAREGERMEESLENDGAYCCISDTKMESIRNMYPQNRNLHGTIFGGFILREATELAWVCASLFSRNRRIRFRALDDTAFYHPIEIGSIVRLSAQVTYADESGIQVRLDISTLEDYGTEFQQELLTNVCHFSYSAPEFEKLRRKVCPLTYPEGLLFLEGRRIYAKDGEMIGWGDLEKTSRVRVGKEEEVL